MIEALNPPRTNNYRAVIMPRTDKQRPRRQRVRAIIVVAMFHLRLFSSTHRSVLFMRFKL